MRIAIVGATGQLGSELLSLWGDRAVGLSRDQLDLTRPEGLEEVLESSRADRRILNKSLRPACF